MQDDAADAWQIEIFGDHMNQGPIQDFVGESATADGTVQGQILLLTPWRPEASVGR